MDERTIKRNIVQTLKQSDATIKAAEERSLPITFSQVSSKNPTTILEKYIMLWEPQDLRLDPEYRKTHEVKVTDDLFTQDLVKGMKLEIEERIPSKGMIKVAVLFQHNMSEFERYNDVVDSHNEKWVKQGCPEDVFNPETGDIFEVEDKYLNHAGDDRPELFGKNTGKLSKARPSHKRVKLLTVTYRLELLRESRTFSLEFTAEDYRGKLVYFNKIKGKDLATLTRRSVQELYGNPEAHGNTGAFLEGISMLVTGKKLSRCMYKNTSPEWASNDYKNPVVNQAVKSAGVSGLRVGANLIRYTIPFIGIISILVTTFSAMSEGTLKGLFFSYFIILGLIYASVLVSGFMLRRAYSLELNRKYT